MFSLMLLFLPQREDRTLLRCFKFTFRDTSFNTTQNGGHLDFADTLLLHVMAAHARLELHHYTPARLEQPRIWL